MFGLNQINRRAWLQTMIGSACGVSASGWMPALAQQLAADPLRKRKCILLWMSGGPSQTDTFDMKPHHENGGEFKEASTNVPGIRFSEHLPQLSRHADKLAIVRSLSTKEGDHQRGSYLMHTGRPPMTVINYPSLGAALAKELAAAENPLPPYVSVAPTRSFGRDGAGPGFLGPRFAPLIVDRRGGPTGAPADSFTELAVDGIKPPDAVQPVQVERRMQLWQALEDGFTRTHPSTAPRAHRTVYESAWRLSRSRAAAAFDLSQESETVRESYGRGAFGQGCLLARRLIEHGVPFVEVSLTSTAAGSFGWDTHANNFESVKLLSGELDAAWASLLNDLQQRGLLETTTVVWMGEFGRTPRINAQAGRDHFPRAWSCVLAGGGIAGGQVYGRTSNDGMEIDEDGVGVPDILATLCAALGVSHIAENESNTGRPIPLVDGVPIPALLA
jgi:hypothetical protein